MFGQNSSTSMNNLRPAQSDDDSDKTPTQATASPFANSPFETSSSSKDDSNKTAAMNPFEKSATAESDRSGLFGTASTTTSSQPRSNPSSLFGQARATSSTTGGLFGNPAPNSTPSLFNRPSSGPGLFATSSGFGASVLPPSTNSSTGSGLFGQPRSQPSGGLFGNPVPNNQIPSSTSLPINVNVYVTPATPESTSTQGNVLATSHSNNTFNNTVPQQGSTSLFSGTINTNNSPFMAQPFGHNANSIKSTDLFGAPVATGSGPNNVSTSGPSSFGRPPATASAVPQSTAGNPFSSLFNSNSSKTSCGVWGCTTTRPCQRCKPAHCLHLQFADAAKNTTSFIPHVEADPSIGNTTCTYRSMNGLYPNLSMEEARMTHYLHNFKLGKCLCNDRLNHDRPEQKKITLLPPQQSFEEKLLIEQVRQKDEMIEQQARQISQLEDEVLRLKGIAQDLQEKKWVPFGYNGPASVGIQTHLEQRLNQLEQDMKTALSMKQSLSRVKADVKILMKERDEEEDRKMEEYVARKAKYLEEQETQQDMVKQAAAMKVVHEEMQARETALTAERGSADSRTNSPALTTKIQSSTASKATAENASSTVEKVKEEDEEKTVKEAAQDFDPAARLSREEMNHLIATLRRAKIAKDSAREEENAINKAKAREVEQHDDESTASTPVNILTPSTTRSIGTSGVVALDDEEHEDW